MSSSLTSICMVVPWFDRIGGYELQAFSLCLAYQQMKIDAFILTTHAKGYPLYEKRQGISIYRIPYVVSRFLSPLKIYLFYLFRRHRKALPSIFHCHAISPFTEQVLSINQKLGIPTFLKIATERDILKLHENIKKDSRKGQHRIHLYQQIRRWISINPNIKKELIDFGMTNDKILSIPNGVDCLRFSPVTESEKIKLKETLGFSADRQLLTFVGRFEDRKRIKDLIEAWAAIEGKYPNCDLLLVGDGQEKSVYKKLCSKLNIQKRVIFLGLSQRVEDILRITTLFVFPSALEGMPNVILEAMASGLPIVSTQISGIQEIIENEKTGILVPPLNVSALSRAIEHLLSHPIEAQQLGMAAREQAIKQFSFDVIVPFYRQQYEKLIF